MKLEDMENDDVYDWALKARKALVQAYSALYECSEDCPPDHDGPFWNEGGAGYAAFDAVSDALRTTGEEL